MISLETAFKYAMKGRTNGPSIKTSLEPSWDLVKFDWPDTILSSDIYDSATNSIEFTQKMDSTIVKASETNGDTYPELGGADVKSLMAFSIAENVTKGFFFRIHHSNYPAYSGEMYIMPVEEDLFVSTGGLSFQTRYPGGVYDTENSTDFNTDDVIRVYPYRLVKSGLVSTDNYESYLFGHPNNWPDFIKQNGAIATRPIFGAVVRDGKKSYISQIPADITVASSGYRYISLPNSLGTTSVIVNGEYRYGGAIHNPGNQTVTNGYSNSNNGAIHRINSLLDNSWVIISGIRTADIFKTANTNETNTGAVVTGQSYEEAGFIIGENDAYSGKYLTENILKIPRTEEGPYAENTKVSILEKSYGNTWIENQESSPAGVSKIVMQDSDIGDPGSSAQDSKLRLYAYLSKSAYNYILNIQYEEMVPYTNNDLTHVDILTIGTDYEATPGKLFQLPYDLDNKQLAGRICYNNSTATFTPAADWLANYYIVNDTIYSYNNTPSGIQLYNNTENSWGIDKNNFNLNNSQRTNYFINKNGIRSKKGMITVTLPYAVIS